eukprot:6108521-Prymnesium_polylepis.3
MDVSRLRRVRHVRQRVPVRRPDQRPLGHIDVAPEAVRVEPLDSAANVIAVTLTPCHVDVAHLLAQRLARAPLLGVLEGVFAVANDHRVCGPLDRLHEHLVDHVAHVEQRHPYDPVIRSLFPEGAHMLFVHLEPAHLPPLSQVV